LAIWRPVSGDISHNLKSFNWKRPFPMPAIDLNFRNNYVHLISHDKLSPNEKN